MARSKQLPIAFMFALKRNLNPLVDFKWNLINFDKLTGYTISIIINWTYQLITNIINFTKKKAQSRKVKNTNN